MQVANIYDTKLSSKYPNDKELTIDKIYNWFSNSIKSRDNEAKLVLRLLMLNNQLSITELVKLQEQSLHDRYDSLKEDASNLSAVTVMYKEKMYDKKDNKGKSYGTTKEELDERYVKLMNKLGFIKVQL